MSNHPIEQDELMAYLDGELEAARAAEAGSHLKQCPECQRLAADLQEVSQMLVSWQVEETEAELGGELKAALEGREQEKPRPTGLKARMHFPRVRSLVWAGGGLAAVVLFAIGVFTIGPLRYEIRTDSRPIRAQQQNKAEPIAGLVAPPKSPVNKESRAAQSTLMSPQPSGTPSPGYGAMGKLVREGDEPDQGEVDQEEQETSDTANAPMIIRTADLGVVVKEFEKARSSVDEILRRHHGHVGELSVSNPSGAARSLTGTLRIPSSQLDTALNDLKALGRVDKESQGGEEVTQEYIDLQARLSNARHTEQRLIEIQRERTGKLSDVLAVEMQISRVRGEIERMEAQRKNMKNQVDFATLNLTVTEDYKAELKVGPPSTATQFRNAAIEGFESLSNGIIAVLLWLLSVGPTLLLWVAILFFPVRMVWKKLRPRLTASK
jgi:uncharacterized MAPEG superfamily protein